MKGKIKEVQQYMLNGQMNTTFWAFPTYFYVQRVPINIVHEEIVDFLKSWSD